VDEHTAVVFDLDARTATVLGNGLLTLRRAGRSVAFAAGTVLSFAEVESGPDRPAPRGGGGGAGDPRTGEETAGTGTGGPAGVAPPPRRPQQSLRGTADALESCFSAALAARDVDGCVAALLDLEQAIVDWSGDTETNDGADYPRSLLRGMVVRLGELARAGATDPAETVAPFVEALVEVRAKARLARDYATSDRVRDRLAAAGVALRDTPDGTTWHLTGG